jgi:hypothetical protein
MEHDTPHEARAELVTKPGEMAAGVTSGRRAGLDLHGDNARRRDFGEEVDLVPSLLLTQVIDVIQLDVCTLWDHST